MNKVYGFLLMVLLLGVAGIADILTYMKIGGDFFIVELFVLGTLIVLGVFLFNSWIGSLFSLTVFAITLLTGVVSFHTIFPDDKGILAILLLSGIAGFVLSLSIPCSCCCRRKTCEPASPVIPQMTFPAAKATRKPVVSTYDEEPSVEPVELNPDDFVELNEIEKLVKKKKGRKKK
jgi:hypothetical protein